MRSATSADVDAVLGLWQVATTEPSTTDDAGSLGALLVHDPDGLVLAVEDDVVVGTVIVAWDGWRGAMYRLAVLPSHRRRGIATRLVDEGERRLRARGAQRLHMIVASEQLPARTFWASAGYEATGQLRYVKNLA